jgi:hypothetical protein
LLFSKIATTAGRNVPRPSPVLLGADSAAAFLGKEIRRFGAAFELFCFASSSELAP